MSDSDPADPKRSHEAIDWEDFYRDYRKPGYVPGYEIHTKLGAGAFGIVYKATKESIGKSYAIKFLKVDDEEIRDAVVRELDTVRYFAQVDHPNLVSIEDMGEVDGIPYIVMAFAGDDTLRRRLDEGRLDDATARSIFVQVARGVQALHEHSLVHFDIKPANVYLKGDVARIGDYGLSKLVVDSRNSLSMGRGTPYYMAPELLRRKGDARSDIYALGVLLYELACGHPPFRGDSEWEVLKQHEEAAPEIPASVDPTTRAVIERAMAKDPAARFTHVGEMRAALGDAAVLPAAAAAAAHAQATPRTPPRAEPRAFEDGPGSPGFENAGPPRAKPRRRRSGAVAALFLFFLPLIGFFVWATFSVRESRLGQSAAHAFGVAAPERLEPLAEFSSGRLYASYASSRMRMLAAIQTLPQRDARAVREVILSWIDGEYDDDLRAAREIVRAASVNRDNVDLNDVWRIVGRLGPRVQPHWRAMIQTALAEPRRR